MLSTHRARVNGPVFVAGWLAGLAVAGAIVLSIAGPATGISGGDQAIAYLVFALVGTLGVGTPLGIYFAMGARSEKLLAGLKDWMAQHNAVIMAVLCLLIGVKLIGDAVSGLTA